MLRKPSSFSPHANKSGNKCEIKEKPPVYTQIKSTKKKSEKANIVQTKTKLSLLIFNITAPADSSIITVNNSIHFYCFLFNIRFRWFRTLHLAIESILLLRIAIKRKKIQPSLHRWMKLQARKTGSKWIGQCASTRAISSFLLHTRV